MPVLHFTEVRPDDLDRVMALEQAGFHPAHREDRATYARRCEVFPGGSLLAWDDAGACVGCIFCEIWHERPRLAAEDFALGHDIAEVHDARGAWLYIASMTLAPSARGRGLARPLLMGTLERLRQRHPTLRETWLLVNESWSRARTLYRGVGFEDVLRLPGFFAGPEGPPQDGLVMRKPLAGSRGGAQHAG